MITFHFFTYLGDAFFAPLTVQSTRIAADNAGWRINKDYRLIVIDDGMQPCPQETRNKCEDCGAEWRESTYWRGGNLRGQECIFGILTDMQSSLQSDKDIVVKVDTDMIIRNLDWLVEFADAHDILMPRANHSYMTYDLQLAGSDDRGSVYGMLYALRGTAVRNLISSLVILPVGRTAPEDQVIGYRTRLAYTDMHFMPLSLRVPVQLPRSANGPDGIIGMYPWGSPGLAPEQYLSCAAVNLRATLQTVPDTEMIAVARQLMPTPRDVQ